MTNRSALTICASMLLLTLLAPAPPPARAGGDETLNFRLWEAPKLSGGDEAEGVQRTIIVLDGDSETDWTEAVEILTMSAKGPFKKPRKLFEMLMDERRRHCESVRDSVLAEDKGSIFYSVRSDSCMADDERSLNRILCGKKSTFILIFTSRHPAISEARNAQVSEAFLAASIVRR